MSWIVSSSYISRLLNKPLRNSYFLCGIFNRQIQSRIANELLSMMHLVGTNFASSHWQTFTCGQSCMKSFIRTGNTHFNGFLNQFESLYDSLYFSLILQIVMGYPYSVS